MEHQSVAGKAGAASSARTDRLWTLHELDILQELPTPVVVLLHETQRGVAQHSCHMLFANASFLQRFGPPRSQTEFSAAWTRLSEAKQAAKHSYTSNILQGSKTHETRMDVHEFLWPLFRKARGGITPSSANVLSKPINIQTASGAVETAVLHLFEQLSANVETAAPAPAPAPDVVAGPGSNSADNMRVCALHQRSPIHMFMFDSKGALLIANKAALEALQPGDRQLSGCATDMSALFHRGTYPGGKEQADRAYAEALSACFDLEVEVHQHVQPYASSKDGSPKWALLEMWPLLDPVDSAPAVLVHRYSITQERSIQLSLTERNEVLQKQNQALERDWQSMLDEKFRLQQESKALAQHLNALLNDKFGSKEGKGFDSDTPIDKALAFLQFIIAGYCPPVQAALEVYQLLSEPGVDLRQPVRLEKQLLEKHQSDMDTEVGASMLQLLQGREGKQHTPAPKDPSSKPDQATMAARSAATASAFSRHPDLAEVPVLATRESLDKDSLLSQRQKRAAATAAFVPLAVTPAAERMLQDAETNWQFDIFGYADATPGNSLSMLGFHLFKTTGLVQEFQLNEIKLAACFRKIESGYNPTNPYHNSIHVASVLQMTHMLLVHGGVMKSKVMDRVHQVASYWSAIVHDFEHGGVNNDFLVKTAHPLAICYNDSSPWENHHLAASCQVLYQPDTCWSKEMADHMVSMRSICISQVLGTDMKKHFQILSAFQAAFKTPPASPGGSPDPRVTTTCGKNWESFKTEDKTLVVQMVLKCADIGHLTAAPRTHKRWALLLEEEFFRQGDKEQALGLAVSPLMDRNEKGGMTRSQLGFFNIVGAPLFMALIELFDEARPMMQGLQENFHHWESGKIAELAV